MSLLNRFKRIPYLVQYLYLKVTTSIAFYPILMAGGFFIFTAVMLYLESRGMTPWMAERLPSFVLIKSWDIAESVLNVMVGALISLMVFSFSMVMVLLNNAASNFSPRILPSLISNKFHQIVLGTYLGTITFCILLVVNMTPNQDKVPLPAFSVFIAISFGMLCLFLFVFFIHSISESVQVGKILESLNATTLHNLKKGTISRLSDQMPPKGFEDWKKYYSDRSGYLRSIHLKRITKICIEENVNIQFLVSESRFVIEGGELFLCDKELSKEALEKILENIVLSVSELAKHDHVIGFKQIIEIALKAMSPGINDPGTAIACINYLSILFMEKMKLPEAGGVVIEDEDGEKLPTRLWLQVVGFEELLTFVLAPLRQYARHDLMVMLKMLEMLKFLSSHKDCKPAQFKVIKSQIEIIRMDGKEYLSNPADYGSLVKFIDTFPKKVVAA